MEVIDLSLIVDGAGNALGKPVIEAYLFQFEYITGTEAAIIGAAGQSVKFGIIIMFFVQLFMKMFMGSSMQFLWELVHQLQFVTLMQLLDVQYPNMIESFFGFFEVASGDLEDLT